MKPMVNNEFGQLKEVIVGTELNFSKRIMDFTFRNMYKDNLKLQSIYNNIFDHYELNYELVQERIDDLDNLANTLAERGIKVIRPQTHDLPSMVYYNNGKNALIESAASNVRDITFTYKNLLIETPISVANRINENKLFMDKIDLSSREHILMAGYDIKRDSLDTGSWQNIYQRIKIEDKFEYMPFIDAANMIKINDDIICNVGSINQWKGATLLKNIIGLRYPETNFHTINMADSHIDGTLIPLKEGVFLANEKFLGSNYIKDNLPEAFKNWKVIYAQDSYEEDRKYWDSISKNPIALASSRGMDINVLSLNRNEILINDDAVRTSELLYKNGFTPVPIRFRHGEIFAGGIHCSTLDLDRDK